MNRFFADTRELSFDAPRMAFARFEQSEPGDLAEADEAVIAFEAVDARWLMDWPVFNDGKESGETRNRWATYWRHLNTPDAPPEDDPYAKIPIYRFEITTRRGGPFFDEVEKFLEEPRWLQFELVPDGELEIDVFGGLFSPPVARRYAARVVPDSLGEALNTVFDMKTWPDSTLADIERALGRSAADYLGVYDIGQGSANALLDGERIPSLYFDLGCGVYRNAHTAPATLKYCWSSSPPIVLSHWDADHWAGANKDTKALSQTWVAPRQSIGPVHASFASSINRSGGRILIWRNAGTIAMPAGQRTLSLSRCQGSGRNGSGLAMTVGDKHTMQSWLLTGDAGYHELSVAIPNNLSAVVVPHHGAKMSPRSHPPAPAANAAYKRLLYSYGAGNRHGRTAVQHPTHHAVSLHHNSGWNHGTWVRNPMPGSSRAGSDVLATALHPGTHLGGTIVSWAQPPNPSATPCGAILGTARNCSISLDQS